MLKRALIVFALAAMVSSVASASPILLRSGVLQPQRKQDIKLNAVGILDQYYIVQFTGPVKPEWKNSLLSQGVRLLDYIPEYAFLARMKPSQAKAVLSLSVIADVERLTPQHRMHPRLRGKTGKLDVMIYPFPGESTSNIRTTLGTRNLSVVTGEGQSGNYVRAQVTQADLSRLSRLEEVLWIEEWHQPHLNNNVSSGITGVTDSRSRVGLYGAGETIAFADTGLDTGQNSSLSADFQGRVGHAYPMRRIGDWSDISGHGTHVIGTAVGSGALSGADPAHHVYTGSFAGVAPEAGIVIQSIGDSSTYVYPPLDLTTLFQPTYDDGARIHSDSWGTTGLGDYTLYSHQVDDFIWNHKDFVVVFPAGNGGRDGDDDGVTDPSCIDPPGTAKNCITVGASESLRSTGRFTTYGAAWPADFHVEPIKTDYISDNSSGMVAWSGRGPCDDGRFKPDICAPGTNIVSDRTTAPGAGTPWWAIYDSHYAYWGGTSMSVPQVAGAAALVREYYRVYAGANPSAALVKATLLNGAFDMTPGQYHPPSYANEIPARPNNVEGWGRLNLNCIEPAAPVICSYVDDAAGVNTRDTRQYVYSVQGSGHPLSVTLVWTDAAGSPLASRELVNNLDLTVFDPLGHPHLGNGRVGIGDNTNNVETVDLPSPAIGAYTVTVTGANVPVGPQPFALVVSGELPGSFVSGQVLTASGRAISGATITASSNGPAPGPDRTTTTGSNGAYSLHVESGDYTVTPSKTGWAFSPLNRSVHVDADGHVTADFTGSAPSAQIQGSVRRTIGGQTNYFVESPHEYSNSADLLYTITAHPSATRMRLHLAEIGLEQDCDYIEIQDGEGNVIQSYTGYDSNVWTDWITGHVGRIRLVSDESVTDYGFVVDGYETDVIDLGPQPGVTITSRPGGTASSSGLDGTYSIGGLEPVSYSVGPALQHYQFRPTSRDVELQPGLMTSGVDFSACPPGGISGNALAGVAVQQSQTVNSPHSYPNNAHLVYDVQSPGASRLKVHFTTIQTEADCDYVYVLDGSGNVVDTYTGTASDVWSSWIPGDTLHILLESDGTYTDYGFVTDLVESVSAQVPVPGVAITLSPGTRNASTILDGSYAINDLDPGLYSAAAVKSYFTFEAAAPSWNVVSGMTTTDADFRGTISAMPSIPFVKGLPDGEAVYLIGKVATAGTDELSDCFYLEEQNRASGIRVISSAEVYERDVVSVMGTLETIDGERCIQAAYVFVSSHTGTLPKVITLPGKWVGGSRLNPYTDGVKNGLGLNNVGLLIRISGKVLTSGSDYCYVDDGSGVKDANGNIGVRVNCGSVAPPAEGSFVRITGISSTEKVGSDINRMIRVRKTADILSIASAP